MRDDFPLTEVSAMALYRTGLLYLQEQSERERAQEYLEEVSKEKRGSEGAILAQDVLRDLNELDRLRAEIHRADSRRSRGPHSGRRRGPAHGRAALLAAGRGPF